MSASGHEYCVHNASNRSHVGRYIYTIAMALSLVAIFIFLKFNGALSSLEDIVISILSTAVLFFACYFVFDKWVWKCRGISTGVFMGTLCL